MLWFVKLCKSFVEKKEKKNMISMSQAMATTQTFEHQHEASALFIATLSSSSPRIRLN